MQISTLEPKGIAIIFVWDLKKCLADILMFIVAKSQ